MENDEILKYAYMYLRTQCDNHMARLIDKLLVKRGVLTPKNPLKLREGFVGFGKNHEILENVNEILKSEGVE